MQSPLYVALILVACLLILDNVEGKAFAEGCGNAEDVNVHNKCKDGCPKHWTPEIWNSPSAENFVCRWTGGNFGNWYKAGEGGFIYQAMYSAKPLTLSWPKTERKQVWRSLGFTQPHGDLKVENLGAASNDDIYAVQRRNDKGYFVNHCAYYPSRVGKYLSMTNPSSSTTYRLVAFLNMPLNWYTGDCWCVSGQSCQSSDSHQLLNASSEDSYIALHSMSNGTSLSAEVSRRLFATEFGGMEENGGGISNGYADTTNIA